MRYLLDANVLMHVANQATGYVRILERLSRHDAAIALSAITSYELWARVKLPRIARAKRDRLRRSLQRYPVLAFDRSAAVEAAGVRADLAAAGHQLIGPMDTLLAGHARRLDCVVITDNVREFARVPDLKVENWRR